jgi:hypothetical protein
VIRYSGVPVCWTGTQGGIPGAFWALGHALMISLIISTIACDIASSSRIPVVPGHNTVPIPTVIPLSFRPVFPSASGRVYAHLAKRGRGVRPESGVELGQRWLPHSWFEILRCHAD